MFQLFVLALTHGSVISRKNATKPREQQLRLFYWPCFCCQQVFFLLQKTQKTQQESCPLTSEGCCTMLCTTSPNRRKILPYPPFPSGCQPPLLVPHSCCRFKPLLVNEGRWKRGRERHPLHAKRFGGRRRRPEPLRHPSPLDGDSLLWEIICSRKVPQVARKVS